MAIQIRRGNAADLVSANLSQGEPFVCLDTQVAGIKGNSDPIYLATGDSSGNALNALKLGGVLAANFPQISSGTWTPTIYGYTTAGSPTVSSASGVYYKIGKLVIIKFSISITSKGGMSGTLCFGGLPFTIGNSDPLVVPEAVSGLSLPSGQIFNLLTGWGGTTYLQAKYASNTGVWALTDGLIADAFSILSAVGILITA